MATRLEVRHVVGTFALNSYDNPDLEYDRSIVELWGSLPPLLRSRTFLHDGCNIVVTMDWTPVRKLLTKQLRTSNWPTKKLRLPAQVEITSWNKFSKLDWYPEFFVESYLYDLFIALNLALPGAANFFNVTVEKVGLGQPERLDLSAYYFETAFRSRDQWPTLQFIDPQTVSVWFNRVRTGFGQIPDSPVERAMFAMLHVCRSSGRPEDIVWLFYAFESLFQTRVGENYSALHERVCLLLQPDSAQEKHLRKNMRAMYDFRSAFVHGGLQIIHPMHNEVMDKRVEKSYGTIVELSQYGTKLLLACLQRYIQENWREVRYKTTVEPANDEV